VVALFEQVGAGCVDVIDDEKEALCRARYTRRAKVDGAWRARRRQLHRPPAVTTEISVDPPAQPFVKALGAIDVGHRDGDDLELRLDNLTGRDLLRFCSSRLWCDH